MTNDNVDYGDLIIDTPDGSDPDLTQDEIDAIHIFMGAVPPGWPTLPAPGPATDH